MILSSKFRFRICILKNKQTGDTDLKILIQKMKLKDFHYF